MISIFSLKEVESNLNACTEIQASFSSGKTFERKKTFESEESLCKDFRLCVVEIAAHRFSLTFTQKKETFAEEK